MKSLLSNAFAPITFPMGFLEAPIGAVEAVLMKRFETAPYNPRVEVRRLECTLDRTLLELSPLMIPIDKQLLLETDSPWTAYFDNNSRGTGEADAIACFVASQLKCRGLRGSVLAEHN